MYIVQVFSTRTKTWKTVYTSTQKSLAEKTWHRLNNDGMTPRLLTSADLVGKTK